MNHGSDSFNGNKNNRTEKCLENFGPDIDLLGIELTVDSGHVPPEGWQEMIYSRMKYYYKKYSKKMIITEFTVNINNLQDPTRLMEQANIYEQLVLEIHKINTELGDVCKAINVLTIGDQFSPYQRNAAQYGYGKNSNPTLFEDELHRKAAWYGTMKGLSNKAGG